MQYTTKTQIQIGCTQVVHTSCHSPPASTGGHCPPGRATGTAARGRGRRMASQRRWAAAGCMYNNTKKYCMMFLDIVCYCIYLQVLYIVLFNTVQYSIKLCTKSNNFMYKTRLPGQNQTNLYKFFVFCTKFRNCCYKMNNMRAFCTRIVWKLWIVRFATTVAKIAAKSSNMI